MVSMDNMRRLLIMAVALLSVSHVGAQYSNTMYFMKGLPQVHILNPAYQPGCRFYIGFPGLSPLQVSLDNNALAPHDVLFYNPTLDSTILFLHPEADKEKFLSNFLEKKNYLNTDVSAGIFSFGFRTGKMYFTFDLSEKAFVRFNYPKDVPSLPVYFSLDREGNPRDFDLSSLAVNASVYSEIALGVSRSFLEGKLNAGIKGKILLGQGNLYTRNSSITVKTSFEDNWLINTDFGAYGSIPFSDIPSDSAGKFDFGNMSFTNPQASDFTDVFLRKPNPGFAFDLGLEYTPVQLITLSVSLLDVGFIRWKNYTYNMTQNTSYAFNGVDMSGFVSGEDTSDFGQALLDTLKNSFVFSYLRNPYTTRLPMHLMGGATLNLTKGISLGIMDHLEIFQEQVINEITVSANLRAGRFFGTTVSYSLLNNEYHDLGFGLMFKPGPFQWYMLFDHIPLTYDKEKNWGIPVPMYAKAFSFRIGLNLVFGCNPKKAVTSDIPLVE